MEKRKTYLEISLIAIVLIALQSCFGFGTTNSNIDIYDMDIEDNDDVELYLEETGDYPDGTYCAEIEYYNPNTGTRNTYDLDVEVEDGDLTVIQWGNGGWLDDSHFYPENISSGVCEFKSDKGYSYEITLGDFGGCGYTDERKLARDIEYDLETITCPECGGEKDSYDDLCENCQQEVTCPNCGFHKYQYDELCTNCEDEITCPECGNDKDSYDEVCDNCQDEIDRKKEEEESCQKCGGYKFSSFDDYCDDCKEEMEDDDDF